MKQIEITTKVNMNLSDVDKLLNSQGFKKIRKSRIEDIYLSNHDGLVEKDDILDILKKSILLRYLCVNNENEYKKITYKNKTYKDNIVISEEKINVEIDDISNAEKLFNILGYRKLVEVKYDAIVYKKDNVELCFQDVENIGLLLEYENPNDFEGISQNKIYDIKQKMLNELKKYNLDITNDFDIKKAYELIKNEIND